jgi:hypothetical protein
MADHERRITPRKSYAIPVRFNRITEQYAMAGVATARQSAKILTIIPLPKQEKSQTCRSAALDSERGKI